MAMDAAGLADQKARYDDFYDHKQLWRKLFRHDFRYRRHRLVEILRQLGIRTSGIAVLDVGFGTANLLFSFDRTCALNGMELSRSAVANATHQARRLGYSSYDFRQTDLGGSDGLQYIQFEAGRSFDVILCSHTLEHVPDPAQCVQEIQRFLRPGGHAVVFVPCEAPGFDPKHVRTYTQDSLCAEFSRHGFEVCHVEGNMHLEGCFRFMDHFTRRRARPVVGLARRLVVNLPENTHQVAMSLIPYAAVRVLDRLLDALGRDPAQLLGVFRKPG